MSRQATDVGPRPLRHFAGPNEAATVENFVAYLRRIAEEIQGAIFPGVRENLVVVVGWVRTISHAEKTLLY